MSIANSFLQKSPAFIKFNNYFLNKVCRSCTSLSFKYEQDPGAKFTNPAIQNLLKSMTRIRIEKIYRKRTVPDNNVDYEFMTTENLENKLKENAEKAKIYLQMPPVVMVKKDLHRIISKDSALKGYSKTKFVFADITFGLKQSQRKVILRQTDGTLEYAPMDVCKRVNQIFAPLFGRKIVSPRMFEAENLKRCLDEHKYEFILDRTCLQYEPYEKDFHDITNKVYCHINESKQFDDLRSTRHFGPMAFFFAWHNIIDNLLFDMIKRDYLINGVDLISLMYQLNNIEYDKTINECFKNMSQSESIIKELKKSVITSPVSVRDEIESAIGKSREDFKDDDICLEFIEEYVKNKAVKKVQLELALQTFREENDEKKKLYEGLRKAHGVN